MRNITSEDSALLKRFKEKAADMELKAVDFLDKNGNIPYLKARYTAIRCTSQECVRSYRGHRVYLSGLQTPGWSGAVLFCVHKVTTL